MVESRLLGLDISGPISDSVRDMRIFPTIELTITIILGLFIIIGAPRVHTEG